MEVCVRVSGAVCCDEQACAVKIRRIHRHELDLHRPLAQLARHRNERGRLIDRGAFHTPCHAARASGVRLRFCLHIGLHLSYGRGQLRILVCDKQVVQGEEKVQVCGRDDYVAVAVNNAGNAVAVKAVGRDQCLHVGFVALSGQNAENASLVDDGNGIKDALVFQKGNASFPCRGSLEARQAAEIMRGSIGADALPLYIAQNKLRKTKHLCSLL